MLESLIEAVKRQEKEAARQRAANMDEFIAKFAIASGVKPVAKPVADANRGREVVAKPKKKGSRK